MRKRLLNPLLYRDEELADLPIEARYLYTGLWCIADREGRLEDRPMRIKADIFPYDDLGIPMVDQWLTMLSQRWIIRYVVDDKRFIQIINFARHQRCHPNEARSGIPMVNHGVPMVDQRFTNGEPTVNHGLAKGNECTSVIGIRYTVIEEPPTPLPASPPSSKPKRTRKPTGATAQQEAWYAEWYGLYPRHDARAGGLKAFCRKVTTETQFQAIMNGLRLNMPKLLASEVKFRPLPATWINGERWTDETTAPQVEVKDEGPQYIPWAEYKARMTAKELEDAGLDKA